MTPRDAIWLGLGALVAPLAYHLACRFSGQHFLTIELKEK